MVKLDYLRQYHPHSFESDVIPDSGKTPILGSNLLCTFESDVIPDSGKTYSDILPHLLVFESDVIPDSGKTIDIPVVAPEVV